MNKEAWRATVHGVAKSRTRLRLSTVQHFQSKGLFVTPWTVVHQAPLFMEFSRQEYWDGWPFPSPGDLSGWRSLAGYSSWGL